MNLTNVSRVTFSFFGGFLASYLGGFDTLLQFYFILIVADFITGLLKGRTHKSIDSRVMYKGIAKKIVSITIIGVAYQLEVVFGQVIPIREITILFYITHEGLSLIENASTFTPVPDEFKKYFEQLKERNEKDD